jgi:hypothetical protein
MGTSTHQLHGTRRLFLKAGFVASATMAAPTFVPSDVLGRVGKPSAHERIHTGVICRPTTALDRKQRSNDEVVSNLPTQ